MADSLRESPEVEMAKAYGRIRVREDLRTLMEPTVDRLRALMFKAYEKGRSEAYVEAYRAGALEMKESRDELLTALERIRDGAEPCECDHSDKDCCALCDPVDYVCPYCIADIAIQAAVLDTSKPIVGEKQ